MFKILLAQHLVLAVFAIGPLVHGATTALVLWVVAVGLVLGLLVPTLEKATESIAAEQSVVTLTARVAAGGGVVALIFAGTVFLMVYRPGS